MFTTFNGSLGTPRLKHSSAATTPGATPVATPFASTVAMVLSLDDHVNVVDTGFEPASNALAVNGVVRPTITLVELGATVRVAG